MSDTAFRVALVSGANRGIGFALSRRLAAAGLHVAMAARDEARGREAAAALRQEGLPVSPVRLDVDDPASVAAAVEGVVRQQGRLDVLVNNAGVFLDRETPAPDLPADTLAATLRTNLTGPLLLMQAAVPVMKRGGYGRIVNLSSSLGSLAEMARSDSPFAAVGGPAYRLSKAALNALTLLFAKELRGDAILVNSACPGWVRTDLGGPQAPLTPDQGADTPFWLATLPDDGPTGGFFRGRQPVAW